MHANPTQSKRRSRTSVKRIANYHGINIELDLVPIDQKAGLIFSNYVWFLPKPSLGRWTVHRHFADQRTDSVVIQSLDLYGVNIRRKGYGSTDEMKSPSSGMQSRVLGSEHIDKHQIAARAQAHTSRHQKIHSYMHIAKP
jgi:hypothetical protein